MFRLISFMVLVGAIWLASTAVPQSEAQRRIDRIVGISLDSNPYAKAMNATIQLPQLKSSITQASWVEEETVQTVPTGRAPSEVFGTPAPKNEIVPVAKTPTPPRRVSPNVVFTKLETIPAPQPAVEVTKRNPVVESTSETPRLSANERTTLVRHIQRELYRVGCYSGAIDGVWGRGSIRGMEAFAQKISAPVPLDKPDYVGLMLIETYNTRACTETRVDKPILAALPSRPVQAIQPAREPKTTTSIETAQAPALPTASPRRLIGQFAQRVRAKANQQRARPASTPKRVAAAQPRVASVERRLKVTAKRAQARRQREKAAEAAAARRASASRAAAARRARARVAKQRRQNARRIRAAERRRAAIRARKRAQRQRIAALRARQQARNKRARRRYRRATPTYGFRSSRRSWVRRAFTHKR